MRISELESRLRKHTETTKSVMQSPFDLKGEIKNMEVHTMSNLKIKKKRSIAFVAVFALCIAIVAVTPFANSIQGFFRDVVRWDGAITGTKYENATNDIQVDVLEPVFENENVIIPLSLTFAYPTEAPFLYLEEVAVSEYKIFDSNNEEVVKTKLPAEEGDKGKVGNGKVFVRLFLHDAKLNAGEEYTIVIEKMYGLKKADAPLLITGRWECKF